MLGNMKFVPSHIEDEIYGIMEDYECGLDLYGEGLVPVVADFLTNCGTKIEWQLCCSEWPDMTGGACFISWVEEGHIHAIGFDYVR